MDLLGEPVKAQMLRFGVENLLIEVVEGSPGQLQVLPREQLFLPVTQKHLLSHHCQSTPTVCDVGL